MREESKNVHKNQDPRKYNSRKGNISYREKEKGCSLLQKKIFRDKESISADYSWTKKHR